MRIRLLITILFISTIINAQVGGDLDVTYGNNGIAEYTITENGLLHGVNIYDTYQLANGKLLAVGWAQSGCSSTHNQVGVILRLNVDGSLDSNFQSGGYGFYGSSGFSRIIPDGSNSFYIIGNDRLRKMDVDGNLDLVYGVQGSVMTAPMKISSIVRNVDGSIILGGGTMNSAGKGELTVSKRLADGSLDTTFGVNGYFIIPYVAQAAVTLYDLTLDSTGRILINGRKQRTQNDGNIMIMRLTPNGVLDTSFANNGVYVDLFHANGLARQIYIENDGKILIAGNGKETSFGSLGMILSRLLPDGTLDTSYGNGGRMHHFFYSDSSPDSIHPFENGYAISGDNSGTIFVTRVNMDGTLNTNFNGTGYILLNPFPYSGYSPNSTIRGNRMIISANSTFAHCAQSKYAAQFIRLFLNDDGLLPVANPAPDLEICDENNNGFAVFDLTQNDALILLAQTNMNLSYHLTLMEAELNQNPISNPASFMNSTNPQQIFARVEKNGTADFDTTSFALIVNPTPATPRNIPAMQQCGVGVFDLTSRISEILGTLDPSEYNVAFFPTESDARGNVDAIIDPTSYHPLSAIETIFVRVTDLVTGCFSISEFDIIHGESSIAVAPNDLFESDATPDGFAIFDLTQNTSIVLNGDSPSDYSVDYFETDTEAQSNQNAIVTPEAYQNTSNPQTIFVRKTHLESHCFAVSQFIIETDATVGIAGLEVKNLKIYPNPAQDYLQIGSINISTKVNASIFTMDGKLMNRMAIPISNENFILDTSQLTTGLYILRLEADGSVVNLKFIKR